MSNGNGIVATVTNNRLLVGLFLLVLTAAGAFAVDVTISRAELAGQVHVMDERVQAMQRELAEVKQDVRDIAQQLRNRR